jgi:hypothetical protein
MSKTESLESICDQWRLHGSKDLREQAQAAIESGRILSNPLLNEIRRAFPETAPLYRGMYLPAGDPFLPLNTGDVFTLGLSSFSRSATVATWYISNRWDDTKQHPYIMTLTGTWRGFDLARFRAERDNHPHPHQEVITAGKFKVQATEPLGVGGKIVHIRQTAVYGIPPGW